MQTVSKILSSFRMRKLILIIADIIIISICCPISNALMLYFDRPALSEYKNFVIGNPLWIYTVLCLFLCFLLMQCFGAYSKFWKFPGKRHFLYCGIALILGKVISYYFINASGEPDDYLIFLAVDTVLTVILVLTFHFVFYHFINHLHPQDHPTGGVKNTIIIGAGRAATMMLDEIRSARIRNDPNNPARLLNVIGLVDDDPDKLHLKIGNIKVLGNTNDIPKLCEAYDVDNIYFSIPSCGKEDRQRILQICADTDATTYVVPYLTEMAYNYSENSKNTSIISQIKQIKIEDLLERSPVVLDKVHIRGFIKDKVCLVTGGGGSIGSELLRQIALFKPKQVIIVDIYENNAYDIQQELIIKYGNTLNITTLIASIRDYDKMELIFSTYRPDIVFHAAAHKHVPLMETTPEEAVKNNIFGTLNVVNLAEKYNVKKFVLISSDKAVNPTNVMGATKRCCEMIIHTKVRNKSKTEFVITRFGNVLGSNGSVIPLFYRQLENGTPLTVTHPDIKRYFMTIPEAVSLVLEAASMAHGGEIFVLDMGEPVKILTLAENMIRLYGKKPYTEVPIEFTGLRPGEKLYEELFIDKDKLKKTSNKKIFIGHDDYLPEEGFEPKMEEFKNKLEKLREAANRNDANATVGLLRDIVPTFSHNVNK